MYKKRNKRQCDYQTMSSKIICAKFANKSEKMLAAGDQNNNALIYNVSNHKPLTVFTPKSSNASEVTAVNFISSDQSLLTGNNRGTINCWDIENKTTIYNLRGHTVQISCLDSDLNGSQLLASGSLDTNTKIWDLRTKRCLYTLKNHKKKVTRLKVDASNRILASASEDGTAIICDIRMLKTLDQHNINSAVCSLDILTNNYVAFGCSDRLTHIYSIKNSSLQKIAQTKNDTMPISCCKFYNGSHLFTTGSDSIKVWKIENNEIKMSDNIQNGAKGVMDLRIGNKIQSIGFNSGVLSYYQCALQQVNFEGQYSKLKYVNNSIYNERNQLSDKGGYSPFPQKRGVSLNSQAHININNKNLSNNKSKILLKNSKYQKNNIIMARQTHTTLQPSVKKNKVKINQTITGNQLKQHQKFIKDMQNRYSILENFITVWGKQNTNKIIQQFEKMDIYICNDALKYAIQHSKIPIKKQVGLEVIKKVEEMIKNKNWQIILRGLQYLQHIISLFRDQMIAAFQENDSSSLLLSKRQQAILGNMRNKLAQIFRKNLLDKIEARNKDVERLKEKLKRQIKIIFKSDEENTP